MTDYAEEQQNELEALQSIYPDEYEELGQGEFQIRIEPEEIDSIFPYVLSLHITYTPTYPDALPIIKIEPLEGDIASEELSKIEETIQRLAEESLGMAMVFSLASTLKEELTNLIVELKQRKYDIEQARIQKEIETEQAKFKGTRVTIEIFLNWRQKFEKEIAAKEAAEKGKKTIDKSKPTGRQLFETDKTLAASDAAFLEEGDVAVDTSLFEREEYISDEDEDENAVWKKLKDED